MDTSGDVEVDPYADNIVPVIEGEEQYQEAVDELPQDQGTHISLALLTNQAISIHSKQSTDESRDSNIISQLSSYIHALQC